MCISTCAYFYSYALFALTMCILLTAGCVLNLAEMFWTMCKYSEISADVLDFPQMFWALYTYSGPFADVFDHV